MLIFSGKVDVSLSKEPQLNNVITAIIECTPQCSINVLTISIKILGGAQIIGKHNISKSGKQYSSKDFIKPQKGNTYRDSIKINIISSPLSIIANASGETRIIINGVTYRYGSFDSDMLHRVIVDEKTGQFGTEGEKYNGVEYRYDYIAGVFIKEALVGYSGENKKIIALLKEMEPSITDPEALCLHADMYKVGIPYGYESIWKEKEKVWDDRRQFKYYLDNGWLNAFRSGGREKWIKEYKSKVQKSWVGKRNRK